MNFNDLYNIFNHGESKKDFDQYELLYDVILVDKPIYFFGGYSGWEDEIMGKS